MKKLFIIALIILAAGLALAATTRTITEGTAVSVGAGTASYVMSGRPLTDVNNSIILDVNDKPIEVTE